MKLFIQIPCHNEEQSIATVLDGLPRQIDGISSIHPLVIDDGSSDRTSEIAHKCGVDYVIRHTQRRGLAATFRTGLDACLERGADIIVNIDGDNQFRGADIPRLIAPDS